MITPYYCCSSAASAAPFVLFEYFVRFVCFGSFGILDGNVFAFELLSWHLANSRLPSAGEPLSALQVDSHLNCHFSSSFLCFGFVVSCFSVHTCKSTNGIKSRRSGRRSWRSSWRNWRSCFGSSTAIHHTHCCVRASI